MSLAYIKRKLVTAIQAILTAKGQKWRLSKATDIDRPKGISTDHGHAGDFHPTNHKLVVPCDIDSALYPISFDLWPRTKAYLMFNIVIGDFKELLMPIRVTWQDKWRAKSNTLKKRVLYYLRQGI